MDKRGRTQWQERLYQMVGGANVEEKWPIVASESGLAGNVDLRRVIDRLSCEYDIAL